MVEYTYNWDNGLENGWELLDYETHKRYSAFTTTPSKAVWGLSDRVHFSPPYSLKLQTSDLKNHHIVAFRPKLPYMPVDYMSIGAHFLILDVSVFNAVEFAMDRFTGSDRRTVAIQWWHRPNNVDRWRYWEAGPFGRNLIGRWSDIPNGQMDLRSNVWYNVFLEARILSSYMRLIVDDAAGGVRLADLNLTKLPANPAPLDARSSTWPKQLRCVVSTMNRKLGGQTIFVDDVKFTVVPTPANQSNLGTAKL